MSERLNYAHALRVIGQRLEALAVESFSLKMDGDDFVIEGRKRTEAPNPVQDTSLRSVWQLLRGKQAMPKEEAEPPPTVVEMRYTPYDIARLDSEEQSNRKAAAGNAEAHSLPQVLRAVGAFVEDKQGRLVAVSMHEQTIRIEYMSVLNERRAEDFTVASFYDYWVHMYLHRKDRPD